MAPGDGLDVRARDQPNGAYANLRRNFSWACSWRLHVLTSWSPGKPGRFITKGLLAEDARLSSTPQARKRCGFAASLARSVLRWCAATWTFALSRTDWASAAPRSHSNEISAADHMPSSHRRYADWTIDRIRRDAALVGPATSALCELILEQRPRPEQGFRSCLGMLRLARPFGAARLEAAATRALEIGALTYGSVRSILDHKLDRHAAYQHAADGVPILHSNIRGSRYYQ